MSPVQMPSTSSTKTASSSGVRNFEAAIPSTSGTQVAVSVKTNLKLRGAVRDITPLRGLEASVQTSTSFTSNTPRKTALKSKIRCLTCQQKEKNKSLIKLEDV
jgi:hypothetical protein